MIWTTGIDVNIFNVIKSITVFIFIKPITLYATSTLSNWLGTTVLNKHGTTRIDTMGIFGAWFDGFIISRPQDKRMRSVFTLVFLLLLTVWIGTVAELIFESGVDAQESEVISSSLVNTTAGRSDTIFYTPGRTETTNRIARLEMNCPKFNTLSTLVDVFTSDTYYRCGAPLQNRTICASGFDLLGSPCQPPVLQAAVREAGKGWSSETWIYLLLITKNWTIVTDSSESDNGFVSFIPDAAFYSKRGGQLFSISQSPHGVPFAGLSAVHCGSGSSLNKTGERIPGNRPFQICLWEFEKAIVFTNADWLVHTMRPGEEIIAHGPGLETESVRSILTPVLKLELSTIGRWVSVQKRETLSNRDIMATLGLLRRQVLFSYEDSSGFRPDTFEVGMWATGSMALRLTERAVVSGIMFQNGSSLVERKVFEKSRQVATVDVRWLVLYFGSVGLFFIVVAVMRAIQKAPLMVELSLEALLGWWMVEKSGDEWSNSNPRARALSIVSSDNFTMPRITSVRE